MILANNSFIKGDYKKAWNLCKATLQQNPQQPDCLAMLGMMCNKAKQHLKAETYLRKCLEFHPKRYLILTELSASFIGQNNFSEAQTFLAESYKLNDKYAKTYILQAKLLKLQNKYNEAEQVLRQLLEINPQSVAGLNNLGNILANKGELNEAMLLFKKSMAINPQKGEAYKNVGLIELKNGNYREAMKNFIKAHRLMPTNISVLFEIGRLFGQKKQRQKALEVYEQIISLAPENGEAMMLSGINYWHMGQFEKAALYFETVYKSNSTYTEAFYRLMRCKADLADWENWDDNRTKLMANLTNDLESSRPLACSPMDLHYYNVPDELQFQVMKRYSEKYNNVPANVFSFAGRNHNKIRVGYLSPDFRTHALGMSVYKMFEHHNREQFEIYVFSQYIPNPNDVFHKVIMDNADYFFNIENFNDKAAAQFIYDNEIDILVDFGGYSTHTKPGILKQKPAPVQLFMFGQPDTTAMPEVDYFISDYNLINQENQKYYTENIKRIPYGFICSPIEPSNKGITRKQLGLADDVFVFCSFCSPYKYEPTFFALWMNLLKQVEDSVLWLLSNGNASFEKNILKQAKLHGVNAKRILFAQSMPIAEHLERMKLADLFLDTRYYSSCSSASHALMAGLPVLTLRGNTNASRQGATVCQAAGLDDMICDSLEEYGQKALELATTGLKLYSVKKRLNKAHSQIAHFNMALNVSHIEKAFTEIWKNYTDTNILK
jgi:predicted O-linked N-acetylglucosamine transferase (SPINDLY family)